MEFILRENIGVLSQACGLLRTLSADQYSTRVPVCFNSAIGGHMRHVLEHYQAFFDGIDESPIDYENRARDRRIEEDLVFATTVAEQIVARLEALRTLPGDQSVDVRVEHQTEANPGWLSRSSARRELLFLLSHTVHHCALIAVCCCSLGVPTAADFGMAPSTTRYLAQSKAS